MLKSIRKLFTDTKYPRRRSSNTENAIQNPPRPKLHVDINHLLELHRQLAEKWASIPLTNTSHRRIMLRNKLHIIKQKKEAAVQHAKKRLLPKPQQRRSGSPNKQGSMTARPPQSHRSNPPNTARTVKPTPHKPSRPRAQSSEGPASFTRTQNTGGFGNLSRPPPPTAAVTITTTSSKADNKSLRNDTAPRNTTLITRKPWDSTITTSEPAQKSLVQTTVMTPRSMSKLEELHTLKQTANVHRIQKLKAWGTNTSLVSPLSQISVNTAAVQNNNNGYKHLIKTGSNVDQEWNNLKTTTTASKTLQKKPPFTVVPIQSSKLSLAELKQQQAWGVLASVRLDELVQSKTTSLTVTPTTSTLKHQPHAGAQKLQKNNDGGIRRVTESSFLSPRTISFDDNGENTNLSSSSRVSLGRLRGARRSEIISRLAGGA